MPIHPQMNLATKAAESAAVYKKMQGEIERIKQEQKRDATVELMLKVYGGIYEKSTAYVNVIIISGYAGIFAIWSFTKDDLTNKTTMLTILLLLFSLASFIIWEIYKMIHSTIDVSHFEKLLTKVLPPDQFFEAIEKIGVDAAKSKLKLSWLWKLSLALTVPTGFGAGFLLMYNFAAKLTNLPLWP